MMSFFFSRKLAKIKNEIKKCTWSFFFVIEQFVTVENEYHKLHIQLEI